MVSDAIQQGRGHFGVAKNRHPFGKGQIGGDDQRGFFVKLADEMEEQSPTGGGERQIAQFIDDHGIGLGQLPGHIPGFSELLFPLQLVHQIDGVIEADAFSLVNGGHAQSRRHIVFPVPVPPTRIRLWAVSIKPALASCSICA